MSMLRVALSLVRSMFGPRAWYLEMARLTMLGQSRSRRAGSIGQDVPADRADQVDDGAGDHVRGLDELVAGGLVGDGEAGPVRIDIGLGAGRVGHGGAQQAVDHQQGVDLLLDAGGGAGAQYPAAVSPVVIGPNTASITVRVPHASSATNRICG
jgi:hypothetical protein